MSNFQIGLMAVFLGIFGFAVLVFSGVIKVGSNNNTEATGTVVVWGVLPQESLLSFFEELNRVNKNLEVVYNQVAAESFTESFVESLATGTNPDLILIPGSLYLENRNKLYTIPYQYYPERTFRDTYVDGAYAFLNRDGVGAFPIAVDPLVLYYNKDTLAREGYLYPPKTWEELTSTISRFRKENRGVIQESAIALGEYENIPNFKAVLSALFLQSGSRIISQNLTTGAYQADFYVASDDTNLAAEALRFYVSFANPINELYSWNRGLPSARDMFLSGRSAFYIGRGSELFGLQAANPNLNFDVAALPNPAGAARPVTYGDFTVLALVNNTRNFMGAYNTAFLLAGYEFSDYISKLFSVPPAQRQLLATAPQDPYLSVFFSAASASYTWPDPNSMQTTAIFRDMIRLVNSGRYTPEESLYEAARSINQIAR